MEKCRTSPRGVETRQPPTLQQQEQEQRVSGGAVHIFPGGYRLSNQNVRAAGRQLPDRGEKWRNLSLAASWFSQAGQITAVLHPGRKSLVQGQPHDAGMYD